jgi:multiple sugar transport system substrate-binding protein
MKRIITISAGLTIGALALAGCSSDGSGSGDGVAEDGSLTLTLSAWSVATTPEFQLLADAFHEKNPNVTVEVKDYDPAEYNTLVTTDLAAGKGPDIITQKEVKFLTTFQEGGQLLDVSDVSLPDGIGTARTHGFSSTTRTSSSRRASTRPTDPGPGTTTTPRPESSPRSSTARRAPTSTAGSRPCRASRTRRTAPTSSRASTTT